MAGAAYVEHGTNRQRLVVPRRAMMVGWDATGAIVCCGQQCSLRLDGVLRPMADRQQES